MKFIIQKNQPYEAVITVKKKGSPTSATIQSVGSFIITDTTKKCVVLSKQMTIEDAVNGKIRVSLTADDTKKLPTIVGLPEDGSRALQSCKATFSVTTDDAGLIWANIPEIYVESAGEVCPTN